MTHICAKSANALQIHLCRELLLRGDEVSPRGMATRELLGVTFEIEDPRDRLTTLSSRRWSPSLAVAELSWHLRGDENVDALAFYTPRWREFADSDGVVRGSCYGARIFTVGKTGRSQWENVRRLLRQDKETRRAVLNFRVEDDVSSPTNDLSCTNTIQFMARDGKLHAFTSMRSNDAIWGVPYDVFLFTCLQELMALEVGLEVGRYYHATSSMHVYQRHYEVARVVAEEEVVESGRMPRMASVQAVKELAQEEVLIRSQGVRSAKLDEFGEFCVELLSRHKKIPVAA